MAELEDAVLPILRNIQTDISQIRTEVARLKDEVARLSDRLDRFESYFTHLLGMTERNRWTFSGSTEI